MRSGSKTQRGYFVNEHAEGDRDFGTFEGKILTTGGELRSRAPGNTQVVREIFQGLTGGGTYKGRMTSPTEVENTWGGHTSLRQKLGRLRNRAKFSKVLAHSAKSGVGLFFSSCS